MKVLHIVSWWPYPEKPNFGSFIKAHIEAIKSQLPVGSELVVVGNIPVTSKESRVEYLMDAEPGLLVNIRFKYSQLAKYLPYLQSDFNQQVEKLVPADFVPDLIHAHVGFPAGQASLFLARKYQVPYLITEHWSGLAKHAGKFWFGWQLHQVYQQASVITAVSAELKSTIQTLGLKPAADIEIVPNVVSNIFHYAAEPVERKAYYLAVMNLVAPKLPHLILEAMNVNQSHWPDDTELIIVGNGPLKEDLLQYADRNRLPVRFLPPTDKINLAKLMQGARGLLHASSFETFGLVVAEALACGTPVMVSDIPALRAQVNASNGIAVPNTVTGWADGLKQFLNTRFDHEVISKASGGTSPEVVGNQFLDLYRQLLA